MQTFLKILLVICVIAIPVSFYYQIKENAVFSAWAQKCISDGGLTAINGRELFGTHYDCYRGGQIIDHVN